MKNALEIKCIIYHYYTFLLPYKLQCSACESKYVGALLGTQTTILKATLKSKRHKTAVVFDSCLFACTGEPTGPLCCGMSGQQVSSH